MSFASALQTSSDLHACRTHHKRLKRPAAPFRKPPVHLRSSAILILLSFLTFVATSSPHRIHHLGEMALSPGRLVRGDHEHHSHGHRHEDAVPADRSAPHRHAGHVPQPPACVVLFVLQSMPILEAEQALVSVPMPRQPLAHLDRWLRPLDALTNATRIRAPPCVAMSFRTIPTHSFRH